MKTNVRVPLLHPAVLCAEARKAGCVHLAAAISEFARTYRHRVDETNPVLARFALAFSGYGASQEVLRAWGTLSRVSSRRFAEREKAIAAQSADDDGDDFTALPRRFFSIVETLPTLPISVREPLDAYIGLLMRDH